MTADPKITEGAYKLLQALCTQISSEDERWRDVMHEVNGPVYEPAFALIDTILGFAPKHDVAMQFAISSYGGEGETIPGCVHIGGRFPYSSVADFRDSVERGNQCPECAAFDRGEYSPEEAEALERAKEDLRANDLHWGTARYTKNGREFVIMVDADGNVSGCESPDTVAA